jgi:hypothetical protein
VALSVPEPQPVVLPRPRPRGPGPEQLREQIEWLTAELAGKDQALALKEQELEQLKGEMAELFKAGLRRVAPAAPATK